MQAFGELLRGHNCIRDDRESHPLKLMNVALNICRGTMNKEDPNEILFGLKCDAGSSSFRSLVVVFDCRRHVHIRKI